jgi:hypothetical protein
MKTWSHLRFGVFLAITSLKVSNQSAVGSVITRVSLTRISYKTIVEQVKDVFMTRAFLYALLLLAF